MSVACSDFKDCQRMYVANATFKQDERVSSDVGHLFFYVKFVSICLRFMFEIMNPFRAIDAGERTFVAFGILIV